MDADDGPPAAAAASTTATAFVSWEEVVVSNDKGRRVVHYYLRDAAGRPELAVVGRERSLRHMSYAVPGPFFDALEDKPPLLASASATGDGVGLKWKTRREVIDWVASLVSDSVSYGSSPMMDRFSDDEDAEPTNTRTSKVISSGKMAHPSKEFSWLGSAWNCRKRRKHYRSFCRNGVTISVHDFVYVMADDNKKLVAYVEDLYEDLRANNMVVVRWFHKIDEVGLVLPPDVSDREIFFSLCLQDLSVQCIDGLAAVLNPQDFEKFQSEAKLNIWEPYLCCRQIDNDDVKPFDIAQLQGYWSQELLRSLYTPSLKLKISCGGSNLYRNGDSRSPIIGSKKKHLLDDTVNNVMGTGRDTRKSRALGYGNQAGKRVKKPTSSPHLLRKELLKQKHQSQQFALGSQVEVLSQDSGIRGCWFHCKIIKKFHDKVKVQYFDVQDAEETGNLEEWILTSRVAVPDKLGIRLCGRCIVRPLPSRRDEGFFNVGTVVDAWWNDGWWEGIVILKESKGKLHVYFPGEQRVSIFSQEDLRYSQDWVGNKWSPIKDRQDIASSFSLALNCKNCDTPGDGFISVPASNSIRQTDADILLERSPPGDKVPCKVTLETASKKVYDDVPNLAKQCQLDGLRWNASRKRRFTRESSPKAGSGCKRQRGGSSSSSQDEVEESINTSGRFLLPKSLTLEQEICKVGGDSLFSAPMALCSNLVMSR